MAIVERGNVVLEVADDDVQRYIDKGYNVTDGHGTIIQRAIPNDLGELKNLVVKYESEIKELKQKLESLAKSEEVVEKPKRNSKKSKE